MTAFRQSRHDLRRRFELAGLFALAFGAIEFFIIPGIGLIIAVAGITFIVMSLIVKAPGGRP